MERFYTHIFSFILPLFIGNVIHMLIVKGDYFRWVAKPISAELFGPGKTYRGFLFMPLICGVCSLFFRTAVLHTTDLLWSFGIGFILGFTYMVAELPNSFIKRRMGISSGQSHPRYKMLQYFVDKIDSLLPVCVVYFFISDISIAMVALLFAVSFVIHVSFSLLLFKIRIKKSF